MDDGVTAEFGRAALRMVDVVVLKGDGILCAGQVNGPVVVAVARGGPVCLPFHEVVGDCDASVFAVACDNMLAADEGGLGRLAIKFCYGLSRRASPYLDMVDPDIRRAIESDGVAAPDILRVQVSDFEVLEDDIVDTACNAESFATDHTVLANALDSLIARHHKRVLGCFVVSDLGSRCSFLLSLAPVVLVDCQLTSGAGSVWCTSDFSRRAFGASEVECLGDDDVEGARLTKVVGQLSIGVGSNSWSCNSTRGFGAKAFWFSNGNSGVDS